MDIIRGIENYSAGKGPVYLGLGNFDGVHKGHQKLIRSVVDQAAAQGGRSLAFIYEPHPAQVLTPEQAPRLLLSPSRKANLLEKLGLNTLIYTPFNQDIARWSPREFMDKILIEILQVREVFVGFNYTFGHKGAGTSQLLQEYGLQAGFGVQVIAPVEFAGKPISSSLVRKSLEDGDIGTAYNMLGYYPSIEGIVIEGEHRGAAIGFPTANIGIDPIYNVPGQGVYAAQAKLGEKAYHCVVNIGSKPTFHQEYPLSIEAHLIDFDGDIYGKEIRVCFLEKIRDEQRFASVEHLVEQISRDRDKAWEIARAHTE